MNSIKALHNIVYRLCLELHSTDETDKNSSSPISFSQGCYNWNNNINYWIDSDEFEYLYEQSCLVMLNDELAAIDLLMQALRLYKGEYLPEYSYNEWVIPVRNRYRNIYVQCVSSLCNLLKKSSRHAETIKICRNTIIIEPFEEQFHIWLIESLLALDKSKDALNHYEYATSMFYNEMGIKPSNIMQNLLLIMRRLDTVKHITIDQSKETLIEKDVSSVAFLCEPHEFNSIYKLEMRRISRSAKPIFLALLTLSRYHPSIPGPKYLLTQ